MKRSVVEDATNTIIILVALVLFCSAARYIMLAGNVPDESESAEYCTMWKIWHDDRRAGVPVALRYGWPDVDGRFYEECE